MREYALRKNITDIGEAFDGGVFQGHYTPESVENLREALCMAKDALEEAEKNMDEANVTVQEALDALAPVPVPEPEPEPEPAPYRFVLAVKSMLAKVGKLMRIPFEFDGPVGLLTFATSNAAVCNVTADGTLVPMKAGTAVIHLNVINAHCFAVFLPQSLATKILASTVRVYDVKVYITVTAPGYPKAIFAVTVGA